MSKPFALSRRLLLQNAGRAAALFALAPRSAVSQENARLQAESFPLKSVRLLPSPYLTALEANRDYLHQLEPDRLLHNFREQAGLVPKAPVYGGWENESIAGHTLGHYLTACSLMYAQTGDLESKRRVEYIVSELIVCQRKSRDGYVGGFTRKRGDIFESGKLAFEEVRRGDIRSTGFDLNGAWSPLYNWHKLFAGLLDADFHCRERRAIGVAEKLGGYIEGVFAALNDAQVQAVLNCEYGGLNESFAELYVRTHNNRWLKLSKLIYDRKVLDPLSQGVDSLANIHANTQIPKLIGLARLYEITGDTGYAKASTFFWETVTRDYSYVIGGNADREYFQAPRSISRHITEQTCESCNSYNMMKLTRHLFAREPKAEYFDYYERTHLNNILAQQNPRTGMFAYMNPLMSGTHREFSKPFDDFWCCVGTGMESHSKHGDSIYWRSGSELLINLFIPSTLDWSAQRTRVEMTTAYPFEDTVRIKVTKRDSARPLAIQVRVPDWCKSPEVKVNDQAVDSNRRGGYLRIERKWRAGDTLTVTLPRSLRIEPSSDDPKTVALLYGPLVLAGDLGPATDTVSGPAPVLVGANIVSAIVPISAPASAEPASFRTQGIVRPEDLTLRSYTFQHERNTAVYFRLFSDEEWRVEQENYKAEQARMAELQARSADVVHLGEMQAERDHDLQAKISYPVVYRGRNGRDARSGGYFEFTMKTRPGPLTLQATYWGEERNRRFNILVDGVVVASERLDGAKPGDFFEKDYPIPPALTEGKSTIRVRFEPETGVSAGPAFGIRLVAASN